MKIKDYLNDNNQNNNEIDVLEIAANFINSEIYKLFCK